MTYFLVLILMILPACSLSIDLTSIDRPKDGNAEPAPPLPGSTLFGNDGIAKIRVFDPIKNPTVDSGEVVAIQADGKIIVGGDSESTEAGYYNHVVARFNSDGTLDESFGTGGLFKVPHLNASDMMLDLKIQADGKILFVVSRGTESAILRFHADGTVDSAFGSGGLSEISLTGRTAIMTRLGIQSDGKIVAAGYGNDSLVDDYDFLLARYNSDGTLDGSFGSGGVTRFDASLLNLRDWIYSMTILADDKIVAGGVSAATGVYGAVFAIFSATGSLELSRSLPVDFSSESKISALAQQSDGKIVMGGSKKVAGNASFFIYRFDPLAQTEDSSFGVNGEVITSFAGWSEIRDLQILSTGEIFVAGDVILSSPYTEGIAVARYLSNGNIDTSFASSGTKFFQMEESDPGSAAVASLAVQNDGRILLAGRADKSNMSEASAFSADPPRDFAIIRMDQSGAFDLSFGGVGRLFFDVGDMVEAAEETPIDQVVQSDGKIISLLSVIRADEGYEKVGLLRLNADGSLDTSFRGTGRFTEEIGPVYHEPHKILLQPDGKILVSGSFGYDSFDAFVMRFLPNGSLDVSFANSGIFVYDNPVDTYQSAFSLSILDSGAILVGGAVEDYNPSTPEISFFILKLTTDGVLDVGFNNSGVLNYRDARYEVMYGQYLIPQADGKIVMGGGGLSSANGEQGNILVRFEASGAIDPTFGNAGVVVIDLNGRRVNITTAMSVAGGGFILAGKDYSNDAWKIIVTKLRADGQPESSYGQGGLVELESENVNFLFGSWIGLNDGGIILVGSKEGFSGTSGFITKLDSAGAIDSSFSIDHPELEGNYDFSINLFGICRGQNSDFFITGTKNVEPAETFILRVSESGEIKK